MGVVVQILGLAAGFPCDVEGHWIVDYDPHFADGRGKVDTTTDRSEAKVWPDMLAFHTDYREAHGLRPDGKPNRPLTAYHLNVEQV